MSGKKVAPLLVAAAALCWGTYGSFVTVIGDLGMSGNVIVFIRFLVTSLPMTVFLLIRDRKQLAVRKKDIILFVLNGTASILFFTSCYTAAVREMKIATAAALLYTAPAIVMILSAIIFKEKLNAKKVICIILSVAGCALVSGILSGTSDGGASVTGILLGLGSALGYALYSIFSRMIIGRGYSVMTNMAYTFSIATVAYLVLICAEGKVGEIWDIPAATGLSAICGVVTGVLAYLLYTMGLKYVEPSRATQIATIEPVFAAVLGTILFSQKLSVIEIIGIAVVVISIILMNVRIEKSKSEKAE